MDAKLTLTIERGLVERAKAYARDNGRSLSDLVESYFKFILSDEYGSADIIPDAVMDLKGSFTAPEDFDYKQALLEELSKKHL